MKRLEGKEDLDERKAERYSFGATTDGRFGRHEERGKSGDTIQRCLWQTVRTLKGQRRETVKARGLWVERIATTPDLDIGHKRLDRETHSTK